ncbi:hypothetical protein C8034_v009431 [Colletotrichum sidae]|uniref:DUF7053 domain-containing protein n=1 Tax=Colletotrichum sidae TaxID=1347389 RepID=A0A4R8T1U4_9PEZI|nr:hypothetical protein C8034_v009431 [Colletotrichum sidae]
MSKRTTFTTISPLPAGITREAVVDFLHNHIEMIDLNPLIRERHIIKPPPHAPPEEHSCVWYSLTDEISYLPGGLATGNVSYTCAFHNLPTGLQTHCYAPMGLDIRGKWTVAGCLPGEPVEPVELGIGAPLTGLYIREDVDMRCSVFTTAFVKKTLRKSHGKLVDRIKSKIQVSPAPAPLASPPVNPYQFSSVHARHSSQSSSSGSTANGSRYMPSLQLHSSTGNGSTQMHLPYRPSCINKPSSPEPSRNASTPLFSCHRPNAPVHISSWADVESRPSTLDGYNHVDYSNFEGTYDVNPTQVPTGDLVHKRAGPVAAELE